MYRVKKVTASAGYTLHIEFTDGLQGTVDVSSSLFGPVFDPLKDRMLFEQVRVDEFGAVCWPNGADLAPDALYLRVLDRQPSAQTSR